MDKGSVLRKVSTSKVVEKDRKILEFCKGKLVLDVGCVGQLYDFSSGNWLHGKIRTVSSRLIGVDIDDKKIEELRNHGVEVLHRNELEQMNIQFDIIVMADVIEHVNDVVAFLNSYGGVSEGKWKDLGDYA